MPKKHSHPLDKLIEPVSITLGTLANNTGIIGTARVLLQDFVAVSIIGGAGIDNSTDANRTNGPIIFGIMRGNLSLVQLDEFLEAGELRASATNKEHTDRPVQILGAVGRGLETVWLRERMRLPTFQEDIGFNFWVWNPSAAMTTGQIFAGVFELFGRWL